MFSSILSMTALQQSSVTPLNSSCFRMYCFAFVLAAIYCVFSWQQEDALFEAGCVLPVLIAFVMLNRRRASSPRKKIKEIEVPPPVKSDPHSRVSGLSWREASANTRPVREAAEFQARARKELHDLCLRPMSSFEILSIFDSLVNKGLEPSINTVAVVVKALSISKKWSAALQFLSSVQKRFGLRPEARLYAQLGLASLKADDAQSATQIYEHMLQVTGPSGVSSGAMSRLLRDCIQLDIPEAKAFAFDTHHGAFGSRVARNADGNRSLLNHVDARLAQFIELNGLDDGCARLLRSIEPCRAEWVMDQEFIIMVDKTRGTASGKVVATVQHWSRCNQSICYPSPGELKRKLDTFIQLNSLPCRCAEALKKMPVEQQKYVMNAGFVVEAKSVEEKASKVESTMALARELLGGAGAIAALLEEFIGINQLDDRCAQSLRKLPRADSAWVMDQEWRVVVDQSRGTAAAKVVGLLSKLKAEQREYEERSTL